MHRSLFWLAGFMLLVSARAAAGGECAPGSLGDKLECTRAAIFPFYCCDDYCRKPMPCITCPGRCGCPDDYCRKPLPCITYPSRCGCPDDYCPKPLPCFCWPVSPSGTRCP
jgi:hypothetical protein